jgi:acyl dehydratase
MEYHQLEVGNEFPPTQYQVDSATVAAYLEAVQETSSLYRDTSIVPPLAVAARAMAALSEALSFPSGAIHVSQELEFMAMVSTRDELTSRARVSRKQDRGKLHLLTIDFQVVNQAGSPVLSGKTSFILPTAE